MQILYHTNSCFREGYCPCDLCEKKATVKDMFNEHRKSFCKWVHYPFDQCDNMADDK